MNGPRDSSANAGARSGRSRTALLAEIAELRERLQEAEATLGAIRDGEVDAFVVNRPHGEAVYTLDTEELVQHLGVIADALPVLISYVDREQRYRFINRQYELWFGRPRSEMRGRHLRELLGEPAYERVRGYVDEALAGRKVVYEEWLEYGDRAACLHGTYVPHVHRGEVRGFVALVEDISERRRAEEALREREAELLKAKEAAEAASLAKDHFLATLSHELRTPLAPVLAVVASLDRDPRLPDEARQALAVIRRNVELEARLIDDLLDLTRIVRGTLELQREVVDLNQVIASSLETLQLPGAAGQITLLSELAAGPASLWADPARLTQVFCNLLGNALKFTPAGGTITLRSRCERESWVAEVADTGAGIDPEALGTIFDAFDQGRSTAARRMGGLGLGLAISRAIVELHGGELRAESAGRRLGSRFIVRLPAGLPAGVVAPSRPAGAAEEGSVRSLSILLVEDHSDTAEALAELLRLLGHRVETARNVAEALAAARGGAAVARRFDLLISDLGLPDGSGNQIMSHLAGAGVPGIALSGYGMEEDVERSREAGFRRHLVKPVSAELLERTIRELMEERVGAAPRSEMPGML